MSSRGLKNGEREALAVAGIWPRERALQRLGLRSPLAGSVFDLRGRCRWKRSLGMTT